MKRGFSLIEVNIAILVVAIGLLSLMSLFPLGLRESTLAHADMQQSSVADYILNRVRSNADGVTNWVTWSNAGTLLPRLLQDAFSPQIPLNVGEGTLSNFPGSGDTTRYFLRIEPIDDPPLRYRVWLRVSERPTGSFTNHPMYYTELIYHGSP